MIQIPKEAKIRLLAENNPADTRAAVENPENIAAMFRVAGFNEFLAKFKDAENFDVTEANKTEIQARFEAFRALPRVIELMQKVALEKVIGDKMGKKLSEGAMQNIGAELERKIFEEHDFQLLENLQKQQEIQRTAPGEISNLEKIVMSHGEDRLLKRRYETAVKGQEEQQREAEKAESSVEALDAVKKGHEIAGGLKENLAPAEKVFFSEAQSLLASCRQPLSQLEKLQANLAAADKNSPASGRVAIPDIAVLKKEFLGLEKEKKPEVFLKRLAELSPARSLENFKDQLAQACREELVKLARFGKKKKAEKKNPGFQSAKAGFEAIEASIMSLSIDSSLDAQASALREDAVQMGVISFNIESLNKNLSSRRSLLSLKEGTQNLQSEAGKKFASDLSSGMNKLEEIQDQLEVSPLTQSEIESVAAHSKRGWFKKLTEVLTGSQDPKKLAAEKLRYEKSELTSAEKEVDAILKTIHRKKDAERALSGKQMELEMAREYLLSALDSVKQACREVRAEKEKEIRETFATGDLKKVLEARQMAEDLHTARSQEPELYGRVDIDLDDEPFVFETKDESTGLKHKMNLKNLRSGNNFKNILRRHVEIRLAKELSGLASINPDSLAKKFKSVENSLGPLAEGADYQAVRLKALENLAGKNSPLPLDKKIALKRALYEEAENTGLLSFNLVANAAAA